MTAVRGPDGRFVKQASESDPEIAAIHEAFNKLASENYRLTEQLQNVDTMLDERGWNELYAYSQDGGLTLGQLKLAHRQIAELQAANPFVSRGAVLRIAYVHGGGVDFSTRQLSDTSKLSNLTAAVRDNCDKPANVRYFFSSNAREELERAVFSAGNIFMLGDEVKKTLQRVPITQISADMRNPDNLEEIWAYRRSWYRDTSKDVKGEYLQENEIVRWYYTDIYDGPRAGFIEYNGQKETIERGKTMIDGAFNRQVGWGYGVPDALAIVAWVRLYKEYMVNGFVMSRALAKFAYKITASTVNGGNQAAAEIARPGQAGSTVVEGAGNQMTPLATAGKGYDFASGRPLVGAIAAGLGIQVAALLGDPASDSGQQSVMDASARLTSTLRRKAWEDFYVRIFRFLGNRQTLVTTWHDISDDQLQRVLQGLTLLAGSGLFEGEVLQPEFAKAWGIANPGKIPEGYLVPNNANSSKALAAATAPTPAPGDQQTPPTDAPKPDDGSGRGKSTGRGKAPNDHNTDTPT